jgi:hypothetical protein
MSATRPDVSAGPIDRSFNPESRPVVNFELSGRAAADLLVVFDCASATVDATTRRMIPRVRIRTVGERSIGGGMNLFVMRAACSKRTRTLTKSLG